MKKQLDYNAEHDITPTTIRKKVDNLFGDLGGGDSKSAKAGGSMAKAAEESAGYGSDPKKLRTVVNRLEKEMRNAAKELEFERAAELRDRIALLRERILELG